MEKNERIQIKLAVKTVAELALLNAFTGEIQPPAKLKTQKGR
jgi:hypothetical protein